jgi:hypothetical protein
VNGTKAKSCRTLSSHVSRASARVALSVVRRPTHITSAVGDSAFWEDLAGSMAHGTRGVDFITIDGGERWHGR